VYSIVRNLCGKHTYARNVRDFLVNVICRRLSVCNVRAPYSAGWNFR